MKTFTNALIKRLNAECEKRRESCSGECLGIGWCQACWSESIFKKD